MKTALFPGSFDPITIAHADILERALPLFDEVVIGIGRNSAKPGYLDIEKRLEIVRAVFSHHANVEVAIYEGLTVNFCEEIGASYMIRGLRSVADFEYEKSIASINNTMMPGIETLFFLAKPEYSAISSTIVRDILKHGRDVSPFLPPKAMAFL